MTLRRQTVHYWRLGIGLQAQIDEWHKARSGQPWNHEEYVGFLREIGYLEEPGTLFQIATSGVDREIATISRPTTCRAGQQRTFRTECGKCTLG